MQGLFDTHGRKIDYIRLSLTDRCNFRCVYCMPPEGELHIPHEEILSYEELRRFCRIVAALGVTRYKVTGGEPLCRKGAVDFMRFLKAVPGVEQVTLTTNGAQLLRHVESLAGMNIDGINVSLDTLNPERYRLMSRTKGRLEPVLEAMTEARGRGIKVKINVVPLKDYNEPDLPDLTRFALEHGYHIRFIELMPVGLGREYAGVSQESIRRHIEREFGALRPLLQTIGNGPAENFSVPGYETGVGFISAMSKKFCHVCNRLRFTSLGYLKTCLHHNIGADIKPLLRGGLASDDDIAAAVVRAVNAKPLAHEFSRQRVVGEPRTFLMNSVGG